MSLGENQANLESHVEMSPWLVPRSPSCGGCFLTSSYPVHQYLAFRVLVEAAHPDLADAVTVHPICQEELYNPGRDVSINPNENSILTP